MNGVSSIRQKLEGPRATREVIAAAETLVNTIDEFYEGQALEVLEANDGLRTKLAILDAIRTGA